MNIMKLITEEVTSIQKETIDSVTNDDLVAIQHICAGYVNGWYNDYYMKGYISSLMDTDNEGLALLLQSWVMGLNETHREQESQLELVNPWISTDTVEQLFMIVNDHLIENKVYQY